MKIKDYTIESKIGDPKKGYILGPEKFIYEIVGHFGTGYKIKVKKRYPNYFEFFFGKGVLKYSRDYQAGIVRTPNGRYEMSSDSISHKNEMISIVDLDGDSSLINDQYAMALFILNHHFGNKTGPFGRQKT